MYVTSTEKFINETEKVNLSKYNSVFAILGLLMLVSVLL